MTKKKDLSDAINQLLNRRVESMYVEGSAHTFNIDWTFLRERDLRKMKKMLED